MSLGGVLLMWETTFEDYLHDTNVLDELSLLRMIPLILLHCP